MAKIELPDYDNTKFASITGQGGGSVLQAPMDKIPMGLLSLSSPSYLAPVRAEEFTSARDDINRNIAYARAFAKIDYPTFQPQDQTEWNVLRGIGAVAGTMADYAFGKLKERQEQEDLTYITETKGLYQREAKQLWADKYEKRLTGFAEQNDALQKEFQAELNGKWAEVKERTPSREMARVTADRARVDVDNSILSHAAESAINFETKYAFNVMDQQGQAKIREIQAAPEWSAQGPVRAKAIADYMSSLEAYSASARGNPLLSAQLQDKFIKEVGKAILKADSTRDEVRFLSSMKKGDYNVQVGWGLPDAEGKRTPIHLMTDEATSWGMSHAQAIQTKLIHAAAAAEARAQTAAVQTVNTNLKVFNEMGTFISNTDNGPTQRTDAYQKGMEAIDAIAKNPRTAAFVNPIELENSKIRLTAEYHAAGVASAFFKDANMNIQDARASIMSMNLGESSAFLGHKDKAGNMHEMRLRTEITAALDRQLSAYYKAYQEDPGGAVASKIGPKINAFVEQMKESGLDMNPATAVGRLNRIATEASLIKDHAAGQFSEGAAPTVYSVVPNAQKKEIADMFARADTPQKKRDLSIQVETILGKDALREMEQKSPEFALANVMYTAVKNNPAATIIADKFQSASDSGLKTKSTTDFTEQQRAALTNDVVSLINKSSYFTAAKAAVGMSGFNDASRDRLTGMTDALVHSVTNRIKAGESQGVVMKELETVLRAADMNVHSTGRVIMRNSEMHKEFNMSPSAFMAAVDELKVSKLREIEAKFVTQAPGPETPEGRAVAAQAAKEFGYHGVNINNSGDVMKMRQDIQMKVRSLENELMVYDQGRWQLRLRNGGGFSLPLTDDVVRTYIRTKQSQPDYGQPMGGMQ